MLDAKSSAKLSARQGALAPLRSFYIQMDEGAFRRFDSQMRAFAVAFGFEAKIRPVSPDPYDIVYYFKREDIDLVGTNHTERDASGIRYAISFYPKRFQDRPSEKTVNVLVEGLKVYLQPVPSAVVTEILEK